MSSQPQWFKQKGEVVYRPYLPKFVGVVRSVRTYTPRPDLTGYESQMVEVAWEDGTVEEVDAIDLNSLDALIAKTEKALATHLASYDRAWQERRGER